MLQDKISVITVVYNDVEHIEETIESFFSQTWHNKEYIVIDGGSTDGTVEIIKKYLDKIDYFSSEKDDGIYDAMNKGIIHCTGTWINILNSGDVYVNSNSLKDAMNIEDLSHTDVIYGNSIEVCNGDKMSIEASPNPDFLEYSPIFRHGSSLIRAKVQKEFTFDLSKRKALGYALDWEMIYRVYKAGYKFRKTDRFIEQYELDGTSNHPFKSAWYNYKITSTSRHQIKKILFFFKTATKLVFVKTLFYKYLVAFIDEYLVNDILPHIPFWNIRKWLLKQIGVKIGKKSFIMKRCYLMAPRRINIGECTDINRGCFIDARGGISIGSNVSISHEVKLVTGSHDIDSKKFYSQYFPIIIKDNAWLGVGCTILQGVTIGTGAIVCAGAVVTHDVADYEVVGGVPAKHLRYRTRDLEYHCIWESPFT